MEKIRVCDLMHKGVIFCYLDDTARDIAKIMAGNQIRSVAVVDDSGEIWGVVSITEMLPLYGRNLNDIKAKDIMKPYKIDIDPQMPVKEAVELMKKKKIENWVIVDPHAGPKRPVGILTTCDIVQFMSGLEAGHMEQYIKLHE
jgi:predicted transcriptional regulator